MGWIFYLLYAAIAFSQEIDRTASCPSYLLAHQPSYETDTKTVLAAFREYKAVISEAAKPDLSDAALILNRLDTVESTVVGAKPDEFLLDLKTIRGETAIKEYVAQQKQLASDWTNKIVSDLDPPRFWTDHRVHILMFNSIMFAWGVAVLPALFYDFSQISQHPFLGMASLFSLVYISWNISDWAHGAFVFWQALFSAKARDRIDRLSRVHWVHHPLNDLEFWTVSVTEKDAENSFFTFYGFITERLANTLIVMAAQKDLALTDKVLVQRLSADLMDSANKLRQQIFDQDSWVGFFLDITFSKDKETKEPVLNIVMRLQHDPPTQYGKRKPQNRWKEKLAALQDKLKPWVTPDPVPEGAK